MATHKITGEVRAAIRMALLDCDNKIAELGRRIGIDPSYLSKYISGAVKSVQHEQWMLLCAYIPEINDRPVSCGDINGNGNAVGYSNIIFNGKCEDAIEKFRSGLIGALIDADLEPESLQKVLKIVKNFKG